MPRFSTLMFSYEKNHSNAKVLHLEVEDLSLRTGHCKDSLTLLEGGARCKLNNIARDFWLGKQMKP